MTFLFSTEHVLSLPLGYIGPGAGFAFLGSFLVLLSAFALVIAAILSWPFRLVWKAFRRRGRKRAKTDIRRVVVVGLDGLDAGRTRRYMEQGKLPNLGALAEEGTFEPLLSTCPPMSPVAWSSFTTGTNPGKHNIFDFLNRSLRSYLPELSSARIESAVGKGKAGVRLLRKSKPFWKVLGEYGVFGTVLRVPITYPPEPFDGLSLSGMCVPDLRGTQGSFTFYTSDQARMGSREGGRVLLLERKEDDWHGELPGPSLGENPEDEQIAPFKIRKKEAGKAELCICGSRVSLEKGRYSEWVSVYYKSGLFRRIYGICRFLLVETDPHLELYVTPINIDPERPALPISHPAFYSIYLGKLLGPFATLGLAEDTWARNEGLITDKYFLDQVYQIHDERERMFNEALKRLRRGLLVCVFDTSDRIQHMFTRFGEEEEAGERAIEEMYCRMDEMVGRIRGRLKKRDLMLVISDHGFTSFRRGVNLNTWLEKKGYLCRTEDGTENKYLRNIDWSRTQAYTFGLSGIYINMKGREAEGIVDEDQAGALKKALTEELMTLEDPQTGKRVVTGAYDADKVYMGPYKNNGPDLVVGFEKGYRASWDAAVGTVETGIFSDNDKAWGGDHCVDREHVRGVFFSSRLVEEERELRLMDVGPTILAQFGVPVPGYMDGKPIKMNPESE